MALINKHLAVDWGSYAFTGRKGWQRKRAWRVRHNRKVRNVYVQFGPLEVTVWYR